MILFASFKVYYFSYIILISIIAFTQTHFFCSMSESLHSTTPDNTDYSISFLPHLQHMTATLLTSLLCAAVYNKPCLKYINLPHNNGNVHPEGDTGVIDFLVLECFSPHC